MRRLSLVSTLVAFTAFADSLPSDTTVVNPRVIVILDSSHSMTEFPGADGIPLEPTSTGGDYDCTSGTNPTCLTKFCGAKQALCETLTHSDPTQSISSHASVGLSTYYQYVLNLIRNDSRTSTCVYDVLEQSGKTRTFTSTVDWTGFLTTKCSGTTPYACAGDTKANFDMTQTSAPLKNVCTNGSYSTTITKTNASPTGAITGSSCYLFNYDTAQSYTYPRVISGGTPLCNGPYVSQTVGTPITTLKYRVPVAGVCAPATSNDLVATFMAGLPTTAASWVNTVGVPTAASCGTDTATAQNTNCWTVTAGGVPGNTNFPTHLYLNAPPTAVGKQAAYSFFDKSVATRNLVTIPAAGAAIGTNTFSAATNYATPAVGTTKTWTNSTYATSCVAGGHTFATLNEIYRITDGTSLATMGWANAATTASGVQGATLGIGLLTSELDKTPTISSTTYTCTAGWPCDIQWQGYGTPSYQANGTTSYAKDPLCLQACDAAHIGALPSAGYCSYPGSAGTDGKTYYTKKSGSCQATITSSTNPVVTPQTKINDNTAFSVGTAWPTNCGAGTASCTFDTTGSTGVSQATTCPLVYRYDQTTALTSAQIDAACPAYKTAFTTSATYGAAATTNYTIFQDSYGTSAVTSCAATVSIANATAALTYKYGAGNATSLPNVTYGINGTTGTAVAQEQFAYMSTDTVPTYDGNGNWVRTARAAFDRGSMGLNTGFTTSQSPTAAPVNKQYANAAYNTSSILDCKSYTNLGALTDGQIATDGFGGLGVGASGAVKFVGKVATGATNCGTEGTDACYTCKFSPLAYEYHRYYNKCNWTVKQAKYTAASETICGYTRKVWAQQSCMAQCKYATTPSRYDWNTSNFKECSYTAVGEQLNTQAILYSYTYNTQGGELFGTYVQNVPGVTPYCSDSAITYNGASTDSVAFRTSACPSTLDCVPGTGTACKLRTNSTTGAGRYTSLASLGTASSGTFSYFNTNTSNTNNPNNATQLECLSGRTEDRGAGFNDPVTPTATTLQSVKAAFCQAAGSSKVEEWRLVSDWYQPGQLESTADIKTSSTWGATTWDTVNWSKPAVSGVEKLAGFSGTTSVSPTASQIFVPVPADGFSVTTQNSAIKNALRKCVMPAVGAGVTPGSAYWDTSGTGVCMRQEADRTYPTWSAGTDFTPLYGSLTNAKNYLGTLIDADDNAACRDYYVILATDGKENTGYSSTDLVNLVSSFKNMTTVAGKTKTLKSYVIGFGAGAASDQTTLDAMQAQGNVDLTTAFSATDIPSLKTALTTIFSSITQGVYSRSKPTLATDGTRLYAGYYTKSGNSPEWKGEVYSYMLDGNGGYNEMWQLAPKLDNVQTDATRVLKAATSYSSSSMTDFVKPGTTALQNALTSVNSTYTSGTIIDFMRNANKNQLFPASIPAKYRNSRLGPVIRSSPVVVGRSPYDITWGGSTTADRTAFQAYLASTATREPRVLVGTDDGMLHAIKEGSTDSHCVSSPTPTATTDTLPSPTADGKKDDGDSQCPNGTEAWAFVPADLVPTLYNQLVPNGVPMGVDGLTSVADICWTGSSAKGCSASDWKTVAIGTMRSGGKGMFALDVTSASSPGYLWGYSDSLLGFTYSSPAIGRVKKGANDVFLALFGAGKKASGGASDQGKGIYVLNAMTGAPVAGDLTWPWYIPYLNYTKHNSGSDSFETDMTSRPAIYRQPDSEYLFAAYFPSTDGSLYTMRFTESSTDNSQSGNTAEWRPAEFWAPSSNWSKYDVNGNTATMTRVALDTAGTASTVPTWKLVAPSSAADDDNDFTSDVLPFDVGPHPKQMKPLINRPKVLSVLDNSGQLPDLFFGTGDLDAASSDAAYKFNYFVALHDSNRRQASSKNDGRFMWGHYFVNPREQVVSEPALVNGCVIVATFEPAGASVNDCSAPGNAKLYGFDPVTGNLNNCLVYTSGPAAWSGKSTSVIDLGPVGIPSDLLVVGNQLYFSASNGGLQSQKIVVNVSGSGVRSFRRIK